MVATDRRGSIATSVSEISVEDLHNRNVELHRSKLEKKSSKLVQRAVTKALINVEKKQSGVSCTSESSGVVGSCMYEDPAPSSVASGANENVALSDTSNRSGARKSKADDIAYQIAGEVFQEQTFEQKLLKKEKRLVRKSLGDVTNKIQNVQHALKSNSNRAPAVAKSDKENAKNENATNQNVNQNEDQTKMSRRAPAGPSPLATRWAQRSAQRSRSASSSGSAKQPETSSKPAESSSKIAPRRVSSGGLQSLKTSNLKTPPMGKQEVRRMMRGNTTDMRKSCPAMSIDAAENRKDDEFDPENVPGIVDKIVRKSISGGWHSAQATREELESVKAKLVQAERQLADQSTVIRQLKEARIRALRGESISQDAAEPQTVLDRVGMLEAGELRQHAENIALQLQNVTEQLENERAQKRDANRIEADLTDLLKQANRRADSIQEENEHLKESLEKERAMRMRQNAGKLPHEMEKRIEEQSQANIVAREERNKQMADAVSKCRSDVPNVFVSRENSKDTNVSASSQPDSACKMKVHVG